METRSLLRWGLCWYRQAPVKRPDAGSIPAAAAFCPWPSGKGARLPTWRGGFDSRRHSRGSANGRLPGFEPGDAGSSPAPRTLVIDAGSSNGRTGHSERPDVGSIPAPATYKRKSSGRMRSLSRKQVRANRCGFESHGFRSNIVPWSSGNDSWPNPG